MKVLILSFALTTLVSAHKFSLKRVHKQRHDLLGRASQSPDGQVVTSNPGTNFSLSTIHDLIYLANITVGSSEYSVQLDTGSSDLWIKPSVSPLPGATSTDTVYNISYALGWASGHLSFAPVEFIGLKVPKQAFIDVDQADNPVLGYGLDGIVGLGFTALSNIDYALNETSLDTGRSLLYNLFTVNPSEPNFLAFSLLRSTDPDDEVEGSFSIGEYEPQYASVANTSRISTWPVHSPKRWTLLLDSMIIGTDIVVPSTQVVSAPSNKAVILMDSGSSYTYAPKSITDAIYANIIGAKFDEKSNQWLVPCDYEVDMAFQIKFVTSNTELRNFTQAISSGQIFPLHPLDVTPTTAGNNSTCVGSFIPTQLGPQTEFDWLVGDNFLRSVYAVYDFGDYDAKGSMSDPYIQFLSLVDPDEASADFHEQRGGQPNQNITYAGLSEAAIAPSFFISDDVSETIVLIGKLVPTMLGIIALNTIILVVLLAGGLCFWMKRRRSRRFEGTRRQTRGRMTPMALETTSNYEFSREQSTAVPAAYQPVSMALTEDTFVPPSPAFYQFEGGKHPSDRPKSIA